jgi:hypothetical protein
MTQQTHTTTGAGTTAQVAELKHHEHQAQIDQQIAALAEAQAIFDTAHAAYLTATRNDESLRNAAQAATAEAERARNGLREILRTAMGRPSKELHAKSAEQRAALELAEEYTALSVELVDEVELAHMKASPPALDVRQLRRTLARSYADALLAEVIDEVAPRLKLALALQCVDEDSRPFNTLLDVSFFLGNDTLETRLERLGLLIKDRMKYAQPAAIPDAITQALKHSGIGQFIPSTPATCHMIQQRRIERGL